VGKEIWKRRLWKGAPLSIRASSGNVEGCSFTGDFERQVKEGSGDGASRSVGALRGEPGRGAPLLGTYKDI
jgi:hypothetical protein